MSNKAIVYDNRKVDLFFAEGTGYTHSVFVCDADEYMEVGPHAFPVEIMDFRNEFSARTYADAINTGVIHV